MSDSWTDFVSADPRFRPEAARVDEAMDFLRAELVPQHERRVLGELSVRNEEAVSVFFSPEGEHQSHCPRCGAELSERELADWMSEDFDRAIGFRLAPRAMPCCGAAIALNAFAYEQPQAFARFGISVMNPEWNFAQSLASQRLVKEMTYSPNWTRADEEEWRARHEQWSADLRAGERKVASHLAEVLGCEIVLVYERL